MKISIVTVCFNSEKTIADTMQSVADQTHPDIEHIIVDGASRDGTLAIIRSPRWRVSTLVSERDGGIYDAMNKGLALATGELVGFLNADDMLAGPRVVADIAEAASRQEIDVVYGDLSYVQGETPTRMIRYWNSGPFDRAKLKFGWMPPHPTFYVRRRLIESSGRFDLGFRIAADYDFMLRYLSRPDLRVAYVPKVLVNMRIGGASNRSLRAVIRKSLEDLRALRKNRIGGLGSLIFKNTRKLPQFFLRPRGD